jgi:hypothetical protein
VVCENYGVVRDNNQNSILDYFQFPFGVPFKHLKLTTTNRFGEFITSKDMTGATQECKDAYKAWCLAKGIQYKDPEKCAAERSLAAAISSVAQK